MLGTIRIHLRRFIGQHDGRVPDQNLRVADAAFGTGHSKLLRRAEGLHAKSDGRGGVLEDQIRLDAMISVRYRFHLGHRVLLL